jgi:hypothetical protein
VGQFPSLNLRRKTEALPLWGQERSKRKHIEIPALSLKNRSDKSLP